jgi:ATP-binding cassette subfamily F protein uup
VKSLSGGEKNRLLLARLFTKPANLLVMDEPTNDLDLETLELLEEKLVDYSGTLLLVSHDRAFLDNVVTNVLVLDGSGTVEEFVGGYSDWQRHKKLAAKTETDKLSQDSKAKPDKSADNLNAPKNPAKKKLSFKEQQELNNLPELIAQLEAKQAELNRQISSPDFYKNDQTLIASTLVELQDTDNKLEQVYQRWDELDSLQSA